jgi:hypothetical protein
MLSSRLTPHGMYPPMYPYRDGKRLLIVTGGS